MISSGFWTGRRVFVTGHTGFKGAWLSLALHRLNAAVAGYALDPAEGANLFDLAQVGATLLADTRADICDAGALRRAMVETQPDIVFHLAAQPLVRAGYLDPLETYRVNALGTAHVLEAARHTPGVRAVVVITSDKCYAPGTRPLRHREDDRLGGRDPYSSSKACAELVAMTYRSSYCDEGRGPVIVTARSGNVIGGGDFAADRIVPDAVRAFIAGKQLDVRRPEAIRPWQHVLEPIYGYLALGERACGDPRVDVAWNFGPAESDARDVASLVDRMADAWGAPASWRRDPGDHPRETDHLQLDSTLARACLGWRPALDFDGMIDWTCAWYRAWAAGEDVARLTRDQIDAHLGQRVLVTLPHTAPDRSPHANDERAA